MLIDSYYTDAYTGDEEARWAEDDRREKEYLATG